MDEELYELVASYMQNQLSEPERKAFEARLETDDTFRAQAKPLMLGELAAAFGREDELRQRMGQWMETIKQDPSQTQPPARIQPLWVRMAIAASVALLLLIVLPRLFPPPKVDPAQLFTENFDPYLPPETRSQEPLLDSALQAAHIAILTGDYEVGIQQLTLILDTAQLTPEGKTEEQLYLGSAYLQHDQPQKALEVFQQIADQDQPVVRWYQALAYLAIGDKEAASERMQQLVLRKGYYERKAKALLEMMN